MSESWRQLDLGRQGPYENGATMPVLVRSVAESGRPVMQTSVWGETHLNVGWFDDVDATLDLERCAARDVLVVRRMHYGGGTAYYGAECAAMWGFLLPKTGDDDLDAQLRRFQPVITSALERIGLGEVRFEGSSDLRWHDRKLGALTAQDVVACTSIGGFLNLDRPDLDLYLDVARVPDEKFKDKAVKDLREYVCTATEVAGEPVTYERFRDALLDALREAGIALAPSDLTEGERRGLRKIGERVASDEQIRRVSSSRFRETAPSDTRVGFGNEKGRKLCRAGVALDDEGTVRAAMLAGDMHVSPPDTMDRVAGALVGAAADERAELRARIADVFEGEDVSQAGETMGVTTDDVLAAVEKAIADAG